MRLLVTTIVRCFVALAMLRAFLVEPIVVPTSSMAPNVLGDHADATCELCGALIRWGTDVRAAGHPWIACPTCGAEQTDLRSRTLHAGDKMLVDRNAFAFRAPRRWELAVLRDPAAPSRWLLKRIVGLPGEHVALREGDVFVDGARVEKSLDELLSLAIPIDDGQPGRWKGESAASGWTEVAENRETRYRRAATQPASEVDWLEFQHSLQSSGRITDSLPYNQDPLRRPVDVRDICVSLHVQTQGVGRLTVRFPAPREPTLALDWEQHRALVMIGGRTVYETVFSPPPGGDLAVTAAYCDGRMIARLGANEIAFRVTATTYPDPQVGSLAIGVAGLATEIRQLTVRRDIHYLPAHRTPPATMDWKLGSAEYLMLGDNPAVSVDARSWISPNVDRKSLLGKPLRLH